MKKKLIRIGIITATLLTTSAFVFNGPETQVDAGDRTPLEIQVENHEERIVDLEVKTDETQTEVNQTKADIKEVQHNTGIASAPVVERVITEVKKIEVPIETKPTPTPAPTPAPTPVPEPIPEPHHLTILSVIDEAYNAEAHRCRYVLQDGRTPKVLTGISFPCQEVGAILTGVNGYY